MQLLGFLPVPSSLVFHGLVGSSDHSKPVFSLTRLFLASSNLKAELLLGYGIISFAVVGADASRGFHQLGNQWGGNRCRLHSLAESNNCLTKSRSALFQVISRTVTLGRCHRATPLQFAFFAIRASSFFRHSSFVIRHWPCKH